MRFFDNIGKLLIFCGIILVFLGIIIIFFEKIPYFGKLPGDIYIKRKNFVFYFPVVTSLILSLIITIIINLLIRRK